MSEVGPTDPRLETIYDKLERMDPTTFGKRAGELLFGLGFSQQVYIYIYTYIYIIYIYI